MKDIKNFISSFNINKTSTYNLSLQISRRGYTYCILDSYSKEYVALKHIGYDSELNDENLYDRIKSNLSDDAFIGKSYKSVDLIFVTAKNVIVPNTVFDKAKIKEIASANFDISDKEEIHFNKIKSISACNVFVVPSFITTLMVNTFPEINFYHQGTPFIENAISSFGNILCVSVNFYYDAIDIAITDKGKLLFYNTFPYKTDMDVLYILSSVIEKTNTDKATPIMLSGYVNKKDDVFKLIYKYFPNVYTADLYNDFRFPFADIQEHQFYNLMNLPCVS
ncbi:MAG: DUF3822 family protein [Bacteroidales bacterium]|nr:DUF3822 family protein [Bacteroidales bacterium]